MYMKGYEYKKTFVDYMHLQDMGIYKTFGEKNKSDALLKLKEAGETL